MRSDVRSAWRALWKTPVATAGAMLTLGLGIGCTTAIFGLFSAVLLRPLPYPDADRLVQVAGTVQREGIERRRSSFPDYFDWRDRTRSFDGIAAWDTTARIAFDADEPTQVATEFVDGPYLDLLGARPIAGRLFNATDHRLDAAPVAVVGESFWNEHLDRAPDVIGRSLRLDSTVYTIVGVVPATFRGRSDAAVVWTPAATTVDKETYSTRSTRGMSIVARLRNGVALDAAQADIHAVSAQLAREFPATNEARSALVVPLAESAFGPLRPIVGLLFAVTLAVLMMACANVASVLLARGESRRHEMSLRRALGSSESRLVRLLVAESGLLVVSGVAIGSLLAQWTGEAILAISPVQLPSFALPQVDWRTVAFVAAVAVAITLALGVTPLVASRRVDIVRALREDVVEARGGGGGRGLRVILVTQVAMAVALLVGAGLLGRSLVALVRFDPGFEPERVLSFRVQPAQAAPQAAGASAAAPRSAPLAVLDALRSVPRMRSAGLTTSVPLVDASANTFVVEGVPVVDEVSRPRAYVHFVSPGYFETLGIRILEGRDLAATDMRPDSTAVVVSENLSKRFWPGRNAIGQRLTPGRGGDDARWLTIVGVVEETTLRGIPRNPTSDPDIFLPFDDALPEFAVMVRTDADPAAILQPAREAIRAALPGAAVFGEQPLSALVDQRLAPARFLAWLTGWFASLALGLAVIGIYGTLSYWVSRRRAEIAVRSALGAGRWDVIRMVVGQALLLASIGVTGGLLMAVALSRAMQALLFAVTPADAVSFAGAITVMMAAALGASLAPALRAARLDPTAALRGDS